MIGPGNFFFGAGFRNILISCITVGEPGWAGGIIFPEIIDLTLTKARTPTAEAVRGIKTIQTSTQIGNQQKSEVKKTQKSTKMQKSKNTKVKNAYVKQRYKNKQNN